MNMLGILEDIIGMMSKGILDNTNLKFIYSSYFFSYYVPFVWHLRGLPDKLGKKYTNDALAGKEKNYHHRSKKLNRILNFLH